MKSQMWKLVLSFVGLVTAKAGLTQNFAAERFTIDGGGGASTAGAYAVTGTIGQPDAGVSGGGSYALVGGFWGVVSAIQTPGAPLLAIERIGNDVRVFWPLPATDFLLEKTTTLALSPAAVPWSPVAFPYNTNTTHISFTAPAPNGNMFFRLRKP